MAKPERLLLRVANGSLVPADAYTQGRLRQRGYCIGDYVSADLRKPRNPGFHRLAHQIGMLCEQNIQDFEGMDAHQVLKRLQVEARVGCDELGIKIPGLGFAVQFIPRSLSFESMSEDEFRGVVRALCDHIARQYWPTMDAEQVERMAEAMV